MYIDKIKRHLDVNKMSHFFEWKSICEIIRQITSKIKTICEIIRCFYRFFTGNNNFITEIY